MHPVTYYSHKYNNGISDLYIYRSIVSWQLYKWHQELNNNNNIKIHVNIDIWLLIIEYIPSKNRNWHCGQIFSTKHLFNMVWCIRMIFYFTQRDREREN